MCSKSPWDILHNIDPDNPHYSKTPPRNSPDSWDLLEPKIRQTPSSKSYPFLLVSCPYNARLIMTVFFIFVYFVDNNSVRGNKDNSKPFITLNTCYTLYILYLTCYYAF